MFSLRNVLPSFGTAAQCHSNSLQLWRYLWIFSNKHYSLFIFHKTFMKMIYIFSFYWSVFGRFYFESPFTPLLLLFLSLFYTLITSHFFLHTPLPSTLTLIPPSPQTFLYSHRFTSHCFLTLVPFVPTFCSLCKPFLPVHTSMYFYFYHRLTSLLPITPLKAHSLPSLSLSTLFLPWCAKNEIGGLLFCSY